MLIFGILIVFYCCLMYTFACISEFIKEARGVVSNVATFVIAAIFWTLFFYLVKYKA